MLAYKISWPNVYMLFRRKKIQKFDYHVYIWHNRFLYVSHTISIIFSNCYCTVVMLCFVFFLYNCNATKLWSKFLLSVTNHILEIHFPGYPISIFEESLPILVNRYVRMYPRGDKYSNDCLSLYLCLDDSIELPLESGKLVELTLSILDQKNAKHRTVTSGSALLSKYQCY